MKFLNVILIVYSLLITNVFGATITDDTLKIGKPGSSANKEITLGTNQKIRSNQSTGALEFTNDGGALYKKLGSGSGSGGSSGVNIITNDSFEDGIGSPWTSSGGTFSQQTYTVGAEDDTKYARFIATTSGQYVEQIVSVKTNLGYGCQADFKKVNIATAGLFKVQALDVSNNVLAEQSIGVSAWIKVPTISFPCPAAGTSNLKLRLISLAAGTIDFDRGYIGSNQNLVYSSQAKLIGTMSVNSCAAGWTTTSTSLASFGAQSGCVYTVTGELLAPLTNIPAFRIAKLLPGDYRIEYEGAYSQTTAAKSGWVRFTDGTNLTRELSAIYSVGGQITVPSLTQTISYGSTQSNVTMELKGYTDSGGTTTIFGVNTTPATFRLWYFPAQSEVAVSNEQSSWFIDANIGGANVNLGTGSVSSYTEILSTGIDLVLNSSKGSASAEIACASGTASSGLNCGGATESIGIAFIPPQAGLHEACFDFSHYVDLSVNGLVFSTFQVVETSNTSSAILVEGGARVMSGSSYGAAANGGLNSYPQKVCGTFNFADTSKKTLRLMYEQTTIATVGQNDVRADRSSTYGQRDIRVTVRPIISSYSRPILTGDQVTTPGNSSIKIASAKISVAGVVSNEKGDFINGNGAGTNPMVLTKNSAFFTGTPNCFAISEANTRGISVVTNSSTININESTYANVGGVDQAFQLFCHGE